MKKQVTMTARRVESIKPDPTRKQEIPAGGVGGLTLVVQTSGSKSWYLRYRYLGRTRNYKIGNFPVVGLADARLRAIDALKTLSRGVDPAFKPAPGEDGVKAVADLWVKLEVSGKRTETEITRVLKKEIVQPWITRKVTDITRADVLRLVDKIVARPAPVTANRVFELTRRWFRWQVGRGYVTVSPCDGLNPPTAETARDHKLSDSELAAVWNTAKTLDYPTGAFIQMMIATGARRSQVAEMKWKDIDLQTGMWSVTAADMKMARATEVPLSTVTMTILRTVPRFDGGIYVFSRSGGKRALTTFAEMKRTLDEAVKEAGHAVAPWTLHDIRRNLSTFCSRTHVAREVAALMLAHSRKSALGSVDAIYDQYDYLPERRTAFEAWGVYLQGLEPPAKHTATA